MRWIRTISALGVAISLGLVSATTRAAEAAPVTAASVGGTHVLIQNDVSACGHDRPAGKTMLDGLTLEEIAALRLERVRRHRTLGLYPQDYHPLRGDHATIYNQIESGKDWTATAPYYLTNPYFLVTLAAANHVTPLNVVNSDVSLRFTEGRFEERRTGKAAVALLKAVFSDEFTEPGKVRIMNVNAHDAGFRFISVDPTASMNVAPEQGTRSIYGTVFSRGCFYHVGRYGKNNLSPEDRNAWLVIKKQDAATRISVKLWRNEPASPAAAPDLLYQCVIDPASAPAALATARSAIKYLRREEYGMPLEPKGRILTGAGQGSIESFADYSAHVPHSRAPGLYMDYAGLNRPEHLRKRVATWKTLMPGTIIQLGLSMTQDGDPAKHYEDKVARGQFDGAIDETIDVLKETRRPLLVRIGYEFNGKWNGYQPADYRRAFRRVAERLRKGLGTRIALAWCFSLDDQNIDFMTFYPGDDVVDWWCVDIFGENHFTHRALAPFLQAAHEHRRPVLIGEATPRKVSVQLGNESVRRWFEPFFKLLADNPGIKGFSYIYWDWSTKPRWKDWGDGRFGENPATLRYFNTQLGNPIFAPPR
jgi:hypothetical protein